MEDKKYELLKDAFVELDGGKIAYRIRLLRDLDPNRGLVKGKLGGYVESENNLSHEGKCWVGDESIVYDGAMVEGDARIEGDAEVYGRAAVLDNAFVSGNAKVFGNARVIDSAQVYG